MNAIELHSVDKTYPLRTARARSVKSLLLSMFRRRQKHEFVRSLQDINLEIPQGSSLGIIGINGAGKSTLLKIIAGIVEPSRGKLITHGRILPMLELGAGFHPELSGYENIFLQGTLLGLPHRQIQALLPSIIDFAELRDFIHMPVKHYSSGMYMRLGFAISAHVDPNILLIDEAFSVGDIYFQQKCVNKILELHKQGCTLLLVTHEISLVEQICEQVVWIDQGKIVASGLPADVAHRYKKTVFNSAYPKPIELVHAGQTAIGEGRYGTGKIMFEYMDFLDAQGHPCNSFPNGGEMEIRLIYHCEVPLPNMDMTIAFQSERGQGSACIFTPLLDKPVHPKFPSGEIHFHINPIDLAPGNYQVSLVVQSEQGLTLSLLLDMHARLYRITVLPRKDLSGIAALDMPCSWQNIPN